MLQRQTLTEVQDEERESETPPSRRHRTTSEIRLPAREASTTPAAVVMTDELRAPLWNLVDLFLFAPHEAFDRWTSGIAGRPEIRRVWSSPPISGDLARIPDDVAELIERWFSLVEPAHVFLFLESVIENLPPAKQDPFAAACNVVLDRGVSDHRFLCRKLVPISSRSDVTAIERALLACRTVGVAATELEERLLEAVDRLARKPEPDRKGAIMEAIRAVEAAAFALTGERHFSLDDALDDLKAKGYLDGALKGAYAGLFAYAAAGRQTTSDDARLIVVMCAGFVSHLAAKM
jgi:hypothetical protein